MENTIQRMGGETISTFNITMREDMKIIKLMTMTNSNFKEAELYRREEGVKEINKRERDNPRDQSERENRENESRSGKTDQANSGAPPAILEQSTCVRSEQVLKLRLSVRSLAQT